MRKLYLFLIFFTSFLQAHDFDCIVIGTSPIPLCEAIYQAQSGKRVLVLDQWPVSGGAWQSITACGVPHVDMGCHQLVGANIVVKEFLENYLGCKMVPMEKPLESCSDPYCPDFYFSKGCHELIQNLEKIITQSPIVYLLNHSVDTVVVHEDHLVVKTRGKEFSTDKVITIPCGYFKLEGEQIHYQTSPPSLLKYWHLYLLIQDPSSPKFSYMNYFYTGISRCMNLTHFMGLTGSGTQLFVFQSHNKEAIWMQEEILADMKKKNLLDPSAYILKSDIFIYEQYPYNTSWYHRLPGSIKEHFEILDTSAFGSMSRYITKWEQVMKPYKELFPSE